MKTVFEHEGIMLEVEYHTDPDGPILTGARVLGDDYRATGPNIIHMLDKTYVQTAADEATKFLSLVVAEL